MNFSQCPLNESKCLHECCLLSFLRSTDSIFICICICCSWIFVKCCLHVAVEEGVGGGEEGGQVGHLDGLQKEDQKAIYFQNCWKAKFTGFAVNWLEDHDVSGKYSDRTTRNMGCCLCLVFRCWTHCAVQLVSLSWSERSQVSGIAL